MVLTVSFVLSPVTGLFCHRHFAGHVPRTLAPASGRQDHTTSPSVAASFVRALFTRLTLPRPSHPAPNVRDDREPPLLRERDGRKEATDLGAGSTVAHWHDGQNPPVLVASLADGLSWPVRRPAPGVRPAEAGTLVAPFRPRY